MSTEPTLFVIDDDEAVRLAIEMLLKSVGLHAKSYASAVDFLDAYDPKQSGCLVLDLRMPGMSGLALQETLATRQVEIPIIFITGHGDVVQVCRFGSGHFKNCRSAPLLAQVTLKVESAARTVCQGDDAVVQCLFAANFHQPRRPGT